MILSRSGYEYLIKDDIKCLNKYMPDGLEKEHIIVVLEHSIKLIYDKNKVQEGDTLELKGDK